jgi:hypothetical protein
MKTVDREKKGTKLVFSPKLLLLDKALSKQDPANLLENEQKCTNNMEKVPLSRQILIMVKEQAFLLPNLLHSQLVLLEVIKMVE